MRNPFEIVEWFEEAIAEYTGAPEESNNAIFIRMNELPQIKASKISTPHIIHIGF